MRIIDNTRVTYGSKISNHLWQDNNGQLIIRDAVLARCGSYDYLESEIVPNGNPSKVIQVYRTPEEVFDKISIASFENKPFCNDHPEDDVCPENARELQGGFIRDIRRGTGEFEDCLIGDIIVTDPEMIDLIKSGQKRELSLGYNTQIIKGEDGKYYMTKIRGNHLALVDSGRAGNATIRDNKTVNKIQKGDKRMARKIIYKTSNRDRFINSLYDEDVVRIEELEDDETDVVVNNLPEDEPEDTVVVENNEECLENPEEVKDDDVTAQLAEIKSMLQQILDIVATPKTEVVEEPAPAVEEQPVVEQTDEDVTTDMTEEQEPTLFDASEEVEEIAEDLTQVVEEEEDVEEDENINDSAASLYANFVNATDSNSVTELSQEINKSYQNRYKKFGGKN